jgi:hypothetical protein
MPHKYARRRYAAQPKDREVGPRDDMREPGRLLLEVNGYSFDLRLDPDRRDVRMWCVYRDGQPWIRGGLERVWRAMQSEMALPIGRRHWG